MVVKLHHYAPDIVDVEKRDFIVLVYTNVVGNVTFLAKMEMVVLISWCFHFHASKCIMHIFLHINNLYGVSSLYNNWAE